MDTSTHLLEKEEIVSAIAKLNEIYPHIPSLALWRAWEYAAYCNHRLMEPVLDLACGDGQFFRLVWGNIENVVGIDLDAQVCEKARASGVYRDVRQTAAHKLPFANNAFASVFSNCALEHMDYVDRVLAETHRVLQPGGLFIASVVTDKFVEWEMLSLLFAKLGDKSRGQRLKGDFEEFHHLRNPFPPEEWFALLTRAGFVVKKYYPILPEPYGRVFMLLDELWHVRYKESELGGDLHAYLVGLQNYSEGFQSIAGGLLNFSPRPEIGAGLVFVAEKQ